MSVYPGRVRDESYSEDQIGAYGAHEQPAIVDRVGAELAKIRWGSYAGILAVVCSAVAVGLYPDIDGRHVGRVWAVASLVCAAVMLLISVGQHWLWRRAVEVWRDNQVTPLDQVVRISWVLHIASYVVLLVAIGATIAAVLAAGWLATSSVLLVLALLGVAATQVLGGVQHVRPSGPPGTVPAHMRRLVRREN